MTPSLIAAIFVAFALAIVSAALGARLANTVQARLDPILPLAAGALLGVTAFDLFPEAEQSLQWPGLIAGATAGYLALWLIGRYVVDVCPSCTLGHSGETSALAGKGALLLLAGALGIHCLLDGVALASGDRLSQGGEWAALFGIGMHKIPEGAALGVLLVGTGASKARAVGIATLVEGLTLIGGVAGAVLLARPDSRLIGALLALVGGGFLYLVAAALLRGSHFRLRTASLATLSFLATGGLFWFAGRG